MERVNGIFKVVDGNCPIQYEVALTKTVITNPAGPCIGHTETVYSRIWNEYAPYSMLMEIAKLVHMLSNDSLNIDIFILNGEYVEQMTTLIRSGDIKDKTIYAIVDTPTGSITLPWNPKEYPIVFLDNN